MSYRYSPASFLDETSDLIDLNEPSKKAKVFRNVSDDLINPNAELLSTDNDAPMLDADRSPMSLSLDSNKSTCHNSNLLIEKYGNGLRSNGTTTTPHTEIGGTQVDGAAVARVHAEEVVESDNYMPVHIDEADLSAESDVENDEVDLTLTYKASRKQKHKDAFADFLKDNQSKSQDHPDEGSKKRKRTEESIIDKAREYQQELFDRAKERNVIAVLDTGSGKTLIAAMLIKHTLLSETSELKESEKLRTVFFLVDSVHLVHQQTKFLETNLADKPIALWGDQRVDLWKRADWDNIFKSHRVVVCTAAILETCLWHSFIGMADISLIVFDEAHHTKKRAPYATIMREYYHKASGRRPKIFGMTASPVDSKNTDIARVVEDLEVLLDSHILTTSDMSVLTFAPKPVDVVWHYDRLPLPFETALCQTLRPLCSFNENLKKYFQHAKNATTNLGTWLADKIWQLVLGDSDLDRSRVVKHFEQRSNYFRTLATMEEQRRALDLVESAVKHVQAFDFSRPAMNTESFSPKVLLLCEKLKQRYKAEPDTRAMVFVRDRLTACLLDDLFSDLQFPRVRSGVLLGFGTSGPESRSRKSQEKTMEEFRVGVINLIFATSVAEEGVDIPQCNLVVRFDLWNSTIQYMQSRGRARLPNSEFAIMIESNNDKQGDEIMFAQDFELYLKQYLRALPGDRLLGRGSTIEKLVAKYALDNRSFETDTGAICSFSNALVILARYAASLAHIGALDRETYEEEDIEDGGFRYTVRLPENADSAEVRGAKGERLRNKALAKRSAAFNCCYKLRMHALLDSNLDSIFVKQKPHNANAKTRVNDKEHQYALKVKPAVWSEDLGVEPQELYISVVSILSDTQLRRRLAPLVLLTRRAMPNIPKFPVYLEEENTEAYVMLTGVNTSICVNKDEVNLLTQYTLAIFTDVFNKTYEPDATQMSYWLAPYNTSCGPRPCNLHEVADVDALTEAGRGRLKWGESSPRDYENKWVVDPFDGKFHYFTESIVPGASIYDPIPEEATTYKKGRKNIIDFSDSHWRKSKRVYLEKTYDANQPVFTAELITTRRNVLLKTEKDDERKMKLCQIAMQTLEVSRLDTSVAATCLILPVIVHRLEDYLLVLEAFHKLDLYGPSAELALEAFTKSSDTNIEEQVQADDLHGMGKNYERLEFIGDSLLKMMSTITVYCRTKCDEYGMHCRRMAILQNQRLFEVSTSEDLGLQQYIRSSGFNRTTWYPELVLIKGRGAKPTPEKTVHHASHDLGDKTIADVSEAIIGACVTAERKVKPQNKFDLGIKAITKLVRSEDHAILSWDEIRSIHTYEAWQLDSTDTVANLLAQNISGSTGYTFRHPRLLRSAFTHSSDQNSLVPDLQRLEFLGDAALDWVCIDWLFRTNPNRNPQWLTEHKMAMVSNKFLAALAVKLGFHKLLFVTSPSFQDEISRYAAQVTDLLVQPDCPRDFWTRFDKPPKALSDLVESYLGAVLVDSNWDYAEVESFFVKNVLWFFKNIEDYDTFANRHPTTYLWKKMQQEYRCRDFNFHEQPKRDEDGELDREGEMYVSFRIHQKFLALSLGTSARYARTRVSSKALKELDGVEVHEFGEKYGCDCKSKREDDTTEKALE